MDLEIAGRSWRLVFTHRVILDIEQMSGVDAMKLHLGDLNARMLRIVLHAVLRQAGAPWPLESTGALLVPADVPRIQNALYRAWGASLPKIDRTAAAARPKEGDELRTIDAWAKARFELRLSDREWLDMTPAMVHALTSRHLDDMRHRETMIALLCAETVNHSFRAPTKAAQYTTYMQHPWPPETLRPAATPEPERPGIVWGEDVLAALH